MFGLRGHLLLLYTLVGERHFDSLIRWDSRRHVDCSAVRIAAQVYEEVLFSGHDRRIKKCSIISLRDQLFATCAGQGGTPPDGYVQKAEYLGKFLQQSYFSVSTTLDDDIDDEREALLLPGAA